jgi:hypothetical protein
LPPTDFDVVSDSLEEVPLRQGDMGLEPGERIPDLCFRSSGLISRLTMMRSGEVVEIAIIGRDGVCGAVSVAACFYAASQAVMQIGGSTPRGGAARFLNFRRDSKRLRAAVCRTCAPLLVHIPKPVTCNTLQGAKARFTHSLLQTGDLIGSPHTAARQPPRLHPQAHLGDGSRTAEEARRRMLQGDADQPGGTPGRSKPGAGSSFAASA